MKMRGGVAMAVENWFFGRAARKIIFEGRWPSVIRAVLRTKAEYRPNPAYDRQCIRTKAEYCPNPA